MSRNDRIPELDGIRGIAILMVLLVHFGSVRQLPAWYSSLVGWGWIGVDLFFVLSGFLITSILIRTKESPEYFRQFYKNRVLRIFPLYYTYLILVAIFSTAWTWSQLAYWTFFGNFLEASGVGVPQLSHLWSLCIEEQFYFAWPLLIYKFSTKSVTRFCVAGIAVAVASRVMVAHFSLPSPDAIYKSTPLRCDALMFGALVAALQVTGVLPKVRMWLPAVSFVGVGLFAFAIWVSGGVSYMPPAMERFGYLGVDLFFAAMIASAVTWQGTAIWAFARSRCLGFFGRLSYGLYVLHFPIWLAMGGLTMSNAVHLSVTRLALGIPLSIVAALISWHLIESRFLRLKDRTVFSSVQTTGPIARPVQI